MKKLIAIVLTVLSLTIISSVKAEETPQIPVGMGTDELPQSVINGLLSVEPLSLFGGG